MKSSTVSVIIPVYNGEQLLAEAIESVLQQTMPPHQVIVVDDGSTDQCATVARRYLPHIQLEQQANAGCGNARNLGVALATGEYLAFLDHDDYWAANKLALQLEALEQSPALEAVFGQLKQICTEEATQPNGMGFDVDITGSYHLNTMLIRHEAFERIGSYEPNFQRTKAEERLCRARAMKLSAQQLPDIVAWRRIHGDNMSIRERPQIQAEYLRIIRKVRKEQQGDI